MARPRAHILVADPDPVVRTVLAAALTYEGFLVATVAIGSAALSTIIAGNFSLVIIGFDRPSDRAGIEIMQQARVNCPALKALFISHWPQIVEHGRDRGLDGFVIMPATIREIIGCVWELYCRDPRQKQVAVPRLDVRIGACAPVRGEAAVIGPVDGVTAPGSGEYSATVRFAAVGASRRNLVRPCRDRSA